MGLFGPDPVVEADLLAKLITTSPRAKKNLAKQQEAVRSGLRDGELLLALAVDSRKGEVVVVTSKRLFIVARGRLDRVVERERISRTRLASMSNGTFVTFIDGPGIMVEIGAREEANRLAGVIDRYLLESRVGPRDIPILFPDFYQNILQATGKPETPENFVHLIDRVSRMLTAGSAIAYFEQAGDHAAKAHFLAEFGSSDREGEFYLNMPDLIIDFLWAWSPECHDSLRRSVTKIHDLLTGPDSFLWEPGDKVTPWDDGGE
ncbi:hypothetical protein [Catellatospora citrea]|uniref:Uncharacterized protein n=1 Tax=Catellatospora citrea TaxID=53366 RepID=A0A8J3KBM6_9ACTN|nr:hypothetical protein [Catellatospora citrea]RKE05651.1 hypothetical protein C8E86_0456 [Catellatospora citrea]GIF97006.1 hypothetical protein Cci01nite_21000 [Catellatospora citrea]